ncbi:MAG: glycosyltransferase [Deltaproteobacteria bacterium]|nr:glycosyltransferase [Deltaproteobacteria bacterium]MBW2676107.1 glycosyltransferase [Deltaproteobacteria bacterium]
MRKHRQGWDYFDKIYCISVNERADRRVEAQIQFKTVGLGDSVEFIIVSKHPHNCEEGIFHSHMDCLRKGLQAGADSIVVFEDDILFDRFDIKGLKNCIDFLSGIDQWNTLFFGCLVSRSQKTGNPSVVKIDYRCSAHAYVVNRHFAETLIRIPWQGVAYDDVLKKWPDCYAAYPAFAFQSNSPTDNDRNIGLDRIRRLLGGIQRIQKRNEFYHRHKTPIIAVHSIIILVIVKQVFL